MKKTIFLCLLILATTWVIAQPKVGQQAGEIALPDLNGKTTRLSDLKGKIVLIDFWASWCGPCRRSNKELASLYAKNKDKGFEIYGISIDEDKSDWKQAVNEDRIKWIQVIESNGWDNGVVAKWKIMQIPTSYLLDKNGKIVAIDPSKKQIEAFLKQQVNDEKSK